jgi:6-pyruvoyl-tetrahydropterin synthase
MDVSSQIKSITEKMDTANINRVTSDKVETEEQQLLNITVYLKTKLNKALKDHDPLLKINSELRKQYLTTQIKRYKQMGNRKYNYVKRTN